jgi:hypothetical protein
MKTNPSRYVLLAEILIIILFHVVKIKQAEKHPADLAFTPAVKNMPIPKLVIENKSGAEYMLVNLFR